MASLDDVVTYLKSGVEALNRLTQAIQTIVVPVVPADFETIAAAEVATIPSTQGYLRIAGYYEAADGGSRLYQRSLSEPSSGLKLQSADLSWWDGVGTEPRPLSVKECGAKGDDVDDTEALQVALDSGEPYIYLPDGDFNATELIVPSTVKRLFGPGRLKQIGEPVTVNNVWCQFVGCTHLTVQGLDIVPSGASSLGAGLSIAFFLAGGTNIKIQENMFNGAARFAIYVSGTADTEISGNQIAGFSQSAIAANETPARLKILNNKITRTIDDIGEGIVIGGGYGHRILNNIIEGGNDSALSIQLTDVSKTVVARNFVYNSPVEGIGLDAIAAHCEDVVIADNLLRWEGTISHDLGMHVYGHGSSAKCFRTIVQGNVLSGSGYAGIAIVDYAEECRVADNHITNPGTTTAAGPQPLHLSGIEIWENNCIANYIVNNTCIDQGGNMTYGVKEFVGTSDGNIQWNNLSLGFVTAAYLRSGANSKVFLPTQVSP